MGLMTIGLLGRAVAGSIWLFIVFSVLALTGGAISNVLMPSLVKRHFPDQIGRMTAAYTTAMSIGMTAAVGFTAPISDRAGADGWRVGLGCWAVLSVLAMLPWLPTLRGDRPDEAAPPRLSLWRLLGSRTAWALTLLFATQSLQAYVAFGWFPTYLRDHGMTAAQAGLLVAFYSALAIPTSMVMPTLAPRGQRRLVLVLVSCYAVSYVGLALVPVGGAWLWMLLAGTASGLFPLALTLFGLRTRTPQSTAAVAAFTQGIGYLLAASGPFLVGITVGRPHDWTGMFVLLFAALAVCLVAGLRASRPTYVDDELGQG
jgi:CP family cyanate transporter-like MFS transporter